MKRFELKRSHTTRNGWILYDREYDVIIKFKEGQYNESQEIHFLNDILNPMVTARILREIGNWINKYHSSICFDSVHVVEWSENDDFIKFRRIKSPCIDLYCNMQIYGYELKKILLDLVELIKSKKIKPSYRLVYNRYIFIINYDDITEDQLIACLKKMAAWIGVNRFFSL